MKNVVEIIRSPAFTIFAVTICSAFLINQGKKAFIEVKTANQITSGNGGNKAKEN